MDIRPIFITGSTGNIGKHVLAMLQEEDQLVRLGLRSASSIDEREGIEQVYFDFSEPSSYRAAVEGCKAVFLLRPPAIANTKKTLGVFIEQAYASGVDHIVFVSVTGADENAIVPHHAVEQKLKALNQSYTILRPGFFSQNLGDAYRDDIRQDNRIYLPSAMGLVNFVDTRDIAEVAVQALANPEKHSMGEYTLVGQEAVSFDDVAACLSKVLGRPIRYEAASILGYGWHLRKKKMPLVQVLVQTVLHTGIRKGQAHIEDDTIVQLLDRPARTIEAYIHDHQQLWNN